LNQRLPEGVESRGNISVDLNPANVRSFVRINKFVERNFTITFDYRNAESKEEELNGLDSTVAAVSRLGH